MAHGILFILAPGIEVPVMSGDTFVWLIWPSRSIVIQRIMEYQRNDWVTLDRLMPMQGLLASMSVFTSLHLVALCSQNRATGKNVINKIQCLLMTRKTPALPQKRSAKSCSHSQNCPTSKNKTSPT